METAFLLAHSYEYFDEIGEKCNETKLLGVFSTRENTYLAIEHFLTQPGFIDYPNDFCLVEYEIDENKDVDEPVVLPKGVTEFKGYDIDDEDEESHSAWMSKCSIFLLHHYFEYIGHKGEERNETRNLGIYSTWEKGIEAIQYFKTLNGFKDLPDSCFSVEGYNLDEKSRFWLEGFVNNEA